MNPIKKVLNTHRAYLVMVNLLSQPNLIGRQKMTTQELRQKMIAEYLCNAGGEYHWHKNQNELNECREKNGQPNYERL